MQFKKKKKFIYHIKQKYSKKILSIIKLSTKHMNVFAISFNFTFSRYKNLNKVFAPRVIPMAEKTIIAPRRSHAQTIRPRQWHITEEVIL